MHANIANQLDYDFIFNPKKQSKGFPKLSFRGNKLFMLLAILLVPLLILGGFLLFSRGGNDNVTLLTSVAQKQTEIVRIADLVLIQNSVKQETKVITSNALVTVSSNLNELTALLAKNGHTLKPKVLQATMDSSVDDSLGKANQSGNLDSVYLKLLNTELDDYSSALTAAYKVTTSPSGQKILGDAYDNVVLLKKQLN